MEPFCVTDLTAAPAPLAAVERMATGAKAVVLPFPPARDAREFGRLARAVRRAKVVAVIAHPLFGRPGWAKVMEWLASGVLGPLEQLELDLRTASGEKAVAPGGDEAAVTRRPDRIGHGLWPALDFALRLPASLPPLRVHNLPEVCELRSVADSAAVTRMAPAIRLTWRPAENGEPAERLRLQGDSGWLELIADHRHATTVRMVLTTGHDVTGNFSEFPSPRLAMAWARHAARHGLTGGPLGLDRLAPLYDWLARA